jgi:hypothetical protein
MLVVLAAGCGGSGGVSQADTRPDAAFDAGRDAFAGADRAEPADVVGDLAGDDADVLADASADAEPVVLSHVQPDALSDIATGEFDKPALEYDPIPVDPKYTHVMSFQMSPMLPPLLAGDPGSGPLILWADDLDTIVFSAADHFFESLVWLADGQIHSGVEGEIEALPAGFSHRFVLVRGQGINATVERWGAFLRADHGREVADRYADAGLSRLGYWTDNGTAYYYQTATGEDAQDTLLAVKADADARGIPLGYLQLDSWWYYKDPGSGLLAGGLLEWTPQAGMFPDGLAAFQAKLGLPLVTHNRWFSKQNHYIGQYPFVDGPDMAFPTTGDLFGKFMDDAKSWGVITYEQDWLMNQFLGVPWLRQAPDRARDWMGWINDAAAARGLTVQICMPGAAHLLDALDHPAIVTIRTSVDHMTPRAKEAYWPMFHTVNLLAAAVGIWPFKDNFETTEFMADGEVLVSVLSGGMVGIGDAAGTADAAVLAPAYRSDGLLLKPDRPATPIDAMFLAGQRPYTVRTWSDRPGLGRWTYVAAFNLALEHPERTDDDRVQSALLYGTTPLTDMVPLPDTVADWHLDLAADLGIDGPVVLWDWRAGTATPAQGSVDLPPAEHFADHAYVVVAPVLSNGLALIGETAKLVTVADRRITGIEVQADALVLGLAGAPGESVTMRAYDARAGALLDPVTVTIGSGGTATATLSR